jgi:hypothetical protein
MFARFKKKTPQKRSPLTTFCSLCWRLKGSFVLLSSVRHLFGFPSCIINVIYTACVKFISKWSENMQVWFDDKREPEH